MSVHLLRALKRKFAPLLLVRIPQVALRLPRLERRIQ
jgi:hypothetical protein